MEILYGRISIYSLATDYTDIYRERTDFPFYDQKKRKLFDFVRLRASFRSAHNVQTEAHHCSDIFFVYAVVLPDRLDSVPIFAGKLFDRALAAREH